MNIWLHAVGGCFLFLLLYDLIGLCGIRDNLMVNFVDKYSFEIYLTHHVYILGPFSVAYYLPSVILNILVILTLTLLSSILIKLLVNKSMMFLFPSLNNKI